MNTTESILSQLTSNAILEDLKAMLKNQDPEFPPVEAEFLKAVEGLSSRIGREETEKLLAAREKQITSDLIYAVYQGFQANLLNFRNPLANQFIKPDCDILLREHIMQTLPNRVKGEEVVTAFRKEHNQQLGEYANPIESYYIYLEVAGPKLAHFWGYCSAGELLPWVEPGYVSDRSQTIVYAMELQQTLGFRIR